MALSMTAAEARCYDMRCRAFCFADDRLWPCELFKTASVFLFIHHSGSMNRVVVAHACDLSIWKAKAGESLKFKASLV